MTVPAAFVVFLVAANVWIAVYAVTGPPVRWFCNRMVARAERRCVERIAAIEAEHDAR